MVTREKTPKKERKNEKPTCPTSLACQISVSKKGKQVESFD